MEIVDLSKLKRDIDERTEYLIFGFVHEAQKLLPNNKSYFNITDLITFGILSFYYIKNKWDRELTSDFYGMEDDHSSICIVKRGNCGLGSTSAYSKGTIDSGIHSWKFRVEHMVKDTDAYFDFVIGVVDQDHLFDDKFNAVNRQNTWFAGSTGEKSGWMKYGKKLEQNDIIEMIINLNDKSLKYIINGIDYGKACSLKENAKYRAAVYMFCVGNKLKLI